LTIVSRLYARLRRQELEVEMHRAVRRAVGDEGPVGADTPAPVASPAVLRGIPVIGRGCGEGAIRGTRPGANLRG
jgi:hypothetical protein